MKRTTLLWIIGFALAVLGSWVNVARAADRTLLCPSAASGSAWSACASTAIQCATPPSADSIVATTVGGQRSWVKLTAVPPTGAMFNCGTSVWTTRAGLSLPDFTSPTPPPSPPVVVAPVVSIGGANWLTWWTNNEPPAPGGYRVYIATTPGAFNTPVAVVQETRYSLANLAPGKYYLAVSAIGPTGIETPKGEVATPFEVPVTPPPPPPPDPPKWVCDAPVVAGNEVTNKCRLQ